MLTFGRALLLWRSRRGLSQADLARLSGVPQSNLSNLETDRNDATLRTVRVLAEALGVPPGTLVDGIPPEPVSGPGERLSRRDLERIADSVHTGKKLPDPRHPSIADNARIALSHRLRAIGAKRGPAVRLGRKADRAWLTLSLLPKNERNSLIQRVVEHAPNA